MQLRNDYLPDYKNCTELEVLNEIISNFEDAISTKTIDEVYLLQGYLNNVYEDGHIEEYVRQTKIAEYGERYEGVVNALIPFFAENLKEQKSRYEKREGDNSFITIRWSSRRPRRVGAQYEQDGATSTMLDAFDSQPREEEKSRTTESGAQGAEVVRYSLREQVANSARYSSFRTL